MSKLSNFKIVCEASGECLQKYRHNDADFLTKPMFVLTGKVTDVQMVRCTLEQTKSGKFPDECTVDAENNLIYYKIKVSAPRASYTLLFFSRHTPNIEVGLFYRFVGFINSAYGLYMVIRQAYKVNEKNLQVAAESLSEIAGTLDMWGY